MSLEEGAKFIKDCIIAKKPFFVGKLGTSELDALIFYINYRQNAQAPAYPSHIMTHIAKNGGVFPATDKTIDAWAVHMITEVLPEGDGYAEWNPNFKQVEIALLNQVAPHSERFPLRSLEPYYISDIEKRWSNTLPEDIHLAVISPFAKSILAQWDKQEAVWKSHAGGMWPSALTEVRVICSGYNPYLSSGVGSWSPEIIRQGWRGAVDSMVAAAVESRANLVLVGCGALSLPICAALKKRGISAIHLGGATQILFGIKGRRWASHQIISGFFNDSWVWPLDSEIPTKAQEIEGGCYW